MSLKLVCVVCLDLYSRLTEHTFNSKDSTESVQMQILTISQNAKCLVIEVVSILQFISLSHYLHEMIQWAIYSLIVKQVFPFQFWHALLVLCTPLSSAQWSYAEIRQKKNSDKNYSGSCLDWHSCKWTVLLTVALTKTFPHFSTPTQMLYFCIPVSGQLQFQLLFLVLRVSAYESFHCKMFLFLKKQKGDLRNTFE